MKRQRLNESIPEKKKKLAGQNQLYTNMHPIGNFKDYDLYVSDAGNISGIAFRIAYQTAKQSRNNKELCASWGSMMCVMTAGRLRVPVELALNRIGLMPREVRLPSEATYFNINVTEVPEMDWPSILVTFGCCILLLFKNKWNHHGNNHETVYKADMSKHISELQRRIGYDPASADLNVPFDFERAKTIRSMLGVNPSLRESAMKYIIDMGNMISSKDSGVGSVCYYLCSILYGSGEMDDFNIMNAMLVTPHSPVLNDPRVAEEVRDLTVALEAVEARHPHCQYFMHMASEAELSKVDSSRFPTLIAVAQALGGNSNYYALRSGGKFRITVEALVKLHRENKAKVEAVKTEPQL